MGWLDELKKRVALGEDVDREKYYVTSVSLATLDRLIAIVEGAEWGQVYDSVDRGYYRGCNLCGVFDMGAHLEHCPYHEDYKP